MTHGTCTSDASMAPLVRSLMQLFLFHRTIALTPIFAMLLDFPIKSTAFKYFSFST